MKLQTRRVVARLVATALALIAFIGIGSAATVGAQDAPEQIVVELQEVNGSGVTGTATLTAVDGATEVILQLEGQLDGNVVHIHAGTCESYEPDPLAPAGDLVLSPTGAEGESTTTVDIPLADWLAAETIIHVHAGEREIEDIIVCGDIVADMAEVTEVTEVNGKGGVNGGPDVGVGTTAFGDPAQGGLLVALGGIAMLFVTAGLFARRGGWASDRRHSA